MSLFVWPDTERPACIAGRSLNLGRLEWRRWGAAPTSSAALEARRMRLERRMRVLGWIGGAFFIALAAVCVAWAVRS